MSHFDCHIINRRNYFNFSQGDYEPPNRAVLATTLKEVKKKTEQIQNDSLCTERRIIIGMFESEDCFNAT